MISLMKTYSWRFSVSSRLDSPRIARYNEKNDEVKGHCELCVLTELHRNDLMA